MLGQARQFDGHRILFWPWEVLPQDRQERLNQMSREIQEIFSGVPCERLSEVNTYLGIVVQEKVPMNPFAV